MEGFNTNEAALWTCEKKSFFCYTIIGNKVNILDG